MQILKFPWPMDDTYKTGNGFRWTWVWILDIPLTSSVTWDSSMGHFIWLLLSFFFFPFHLFLKFYWSIADLQCCISFRCTVKCSVIHIFILLQILFSYRLSQNIESSSRYYTVGLYRLPVLYIVLCVC